MKIFRKALGALFGVAIISVGFVVLIKAASSVDLGTADDFALLAGSTITNTGDSVINGDLGLSPGTSVTGFPPGTLNGTQHVANTTADGAKTDLVTAYNDAAGQTPVTTVPTELGGTTKTAGIYKSTAGTFGITGTLTLDAEGDVDAVFIFKTASTLITANDSIIVLTNGAQACNVFWQVGSSATLGKNSTFKGTILALTSATLTTGADVEGRVLARNGAVTLDTNTVTVATCAIPPTPELPATPTDTPPLINITKIPTPLTLPGGAGPVTYNYTVTNIGTVAMSSVTVSDNKCSTVSFVSGDANNDSKLDTSETWKYACSTTLSKTTTNTATAAGQANGFTASDTANATVVVGSSLVPPLIHIVKVPSEFIISGSGKITYTYTVTNPGTAPLNNVSVIDDKCTGLPGRVTGHPGDINSNDLLESSETWTFTCESDLTETTTNIGTAEGHANGLTAIDFSPATVVVTVPASTADSSTPAETTTVDATATTTTTSSAPGFPSTGLEPDSSNNIIWKIILTLGTLILIPTFLYFTVNKTR